MKLLASTVITGQQFFQPLQSSHQDVSTSRWSPQQVLHFNSTSRSHSLSTVSNQEAIACTPRSTDPFRSLVVAPLPVGIEPAASSCTRLFSLKERVRGERTSQRDRYKFFSSFTTQTTHYLQHDLLDPQQDAWTYRLHLARRCTLCKNVQDEQSPTRGEVSPLPAQIAPFLPRSYCMTDNSLLCYDRLNYLVNKEASFLFRLSTTSLW